MKCCSSRTCAKAATNPSQAELFAPQALSVSELSRYVRQLLEGDPALQDVWVQGEVSNLSRPSSGHLYFTLKDEQSALRCVIWRAQAVRLRAGLQNEIGRAHV